MGCHVIDLSMWLLGNMVAVEVVLTSAIGNGSKDEAFVRVRVTEELNGEMRMSWCKEGYRLPDIGIEIKGSKGTLTVNEDRIQLKFLNGQTSILYKQDLNDFVPVFIGGSQYQRQDNQFVKAVCMGANVEPNFHTASKVHKLADQIEQYAKGIVVS